MHPLLQHLTAPSSLSGNFRTTLLAAARVCTGDTAGTVEAFGHIEKSYHEKAYELAVLQALPLIGAPRVLNAAYELAKHGVTGSRTETLEGYDRDGREVLERGLKQFEMVYGKHAERVRRQVEDAHPAMWDWCVGCIYGSILSRPIGGGGDISVKERELTLVAVLSSDEKAEKQLQSHLLGARNVGATGEEIAYVLRQTGLIVGEEVGEKAWRAWLKVRE